MADTMSNMKEFEKDINAVNNDPINTRKAYKILFEWKAPVAILEDEYKVVDKAAVIDQTRYEFVSHLLDIHRMFCTACPRFVPGSLPVGSERDTAEGRSAAFRQSQQHELNKEKEETQTTDSIYGIQSDASISLQDDKTQDCDGGKNKVRETDVPMLVTCPGEDDESRADGNISSTENPLEERDACCSSNITSENLRYQQASEALSSDKNACWTSNITSENLRCHQQTSGVQSSDKSELIQVDLKQDYLGNNGFRREDNCHEPSNNHMRTHTESIKKPYQCSECNKRFRGKAVLTIHMRTHTGEKPFQCPQCNKGFATNSYLVAHMRIHTGEKPYKCDQCGQCFSRKYLLKCHMETHTGEVMKPYQCSECDKKFRGKSALTCHMRSHTGEKPFKCPNCNKGFARNHDLVVHMRIHTGEKPYQCHKCGQCFGHKTALNNHIKTHPGESAKRYQCTICNRKCRVQSELACHMRSHTGERPFQCPYCNKGFARNSELGVHIRIHTGEKPYQCHKCGQCFSQKYLLNYHDMETHIGEIMKPYL